MITGYMRNSNTMNEARELFDEMRKQNMQGKYGAVTMCVGTGQGACGIFEFLK